MKRLGICLLLLFFAAGCGRTATLKISALETKFKPALTNYLADSSVNNTLRINTIVDNRAQFVGMKVADTKWEASVKKNIPDEKVRDLIHTELSRELKRAGFRLLDTPDVTYTLDVELRAFSAEVLGFIIARAAGMTSIQFTLRKDGEIILEKVYEKVVQDNDPEYSGSKITYYELAMKTLMSDSLRETFEMFFEDLNAVFLEN